MRKSILSSPTDTTTEVDLSAGSYAMYGLKQSGRQSNKCLDEALQSFGLIKSKLDPCVYYTKEIDLIIAIYVY